MSRAQRFAFLGVAAVIAIVAVFVLADSSEDDTDGERSAATATATAEPTETAAPDAEETATPTPTPEPTPEPPPLLRAGRVAELEYEQGDTVRLRIRSDVAEHVHVHGYDLLVDVVPGRTARMQFEADITGIFEIEFENSHEQIAELRVNPR
jgi:FtsP/CotA-like multicopper oxidase with cupredoxin domain